MRQAPGEDQSSRGSTPIVSRTRAALRIKTGEGGLVGSIAALFAVTQAGQGLGANAADTLFFVRFGVEFLPAMILVSGPIAMLATLTYAAGLGRVGASRWLPATLTAFAGLLVVERAGVAVDSPGVYPLIWLGAQVAILISYTAMWNAAGEACTTRQAKRLYPLFATAGIGGGIIGNAASGPLASSVGTENLLLVHAASLLAASLLMASFVRRFFTQPHGGIRPSVVADLRAGLDVTRKSPLLRLVAWSSIAFSILFFLVAFPFSEVVAASFQTESEMAGYLGLFAAAATAVTFLVSLFGANRLFARFGVVAALLIVPAVYLAGLGLWLLSFGLAAATLVRGTQWVAVNALGGTAWNSLFSVLPSRRRSQAMAFISGVPSQVGIMASGALLLVGSALPARWRIGIGLATAIWAVVLVWRMRRAYSEALVHAVRQGTVEIFAAPVQGVGGHGVGAEALSALSLALDDPRPGTRAVAAAMLGRLETTKALQGLEKALTDPEPRVRVAVLDGLANDPASVGLAQRLLEDPAAEVRVRASQILVRYRADPGPSGRVALTDIEPAVRASVASLVEPDLGRAVLEEMLLSNDPSEILAALDAAARQPLLGEAEPHAYTEHPDRRVRAAAARYMAGRPALGNVLRQMLDDRSVRVRTAAAEALAVDTASIRVLGAVLGTGSVRATDAALRALVSSGQGLEHMREWIAGEVNRARYLRDNRLALADGVASPTHEYLRRLLLMRQLRLERWALLALSSPDLEAAMPVVRRGVWSQDPEVRSQALEALDSIARGVEIRGLLALLEDDPLPHTASARSALKVLSHDHDEWIRALAIRSLSEELAAAFEQLTSASGIDESDVVRAALSRWKPPHMEDLQSLDTMDRVLALQRVAVFSDIDPEDLERVASVTTERRYEADETIYKAGAIGDEMLVIVAGVADVRRPDGSLVRTYGSGEHVGELALLRRGVRVADVVAGADGVHGLALSAAELEAILEERPEVAMAMLATLAERLSTM